MKRNLSGVLTQAHVEESEKGPTFPKPKGGNSISNMKILDLGLSKINPRPPHQIQRHTKTKTKSKTQIKFSGKLGAWRVKFKYAEANLRRL